MSNPSTARAILDLKALIADQCAIFKNWPDRPDPLVLIGKANKPLEKRFYAVVLKRRSYINLESTSIDDLHILLKSKLAASEKEALEDLLEKTMLEIDKAVVESLSGKRR